MERVWVVKSMKFFQAMLRRLCVSGIQRVTLSSSSLSVIDLRWHQSLLRTKKWHRNRQQVFYWCSFYILTWHIRFIREKKRKTTNFLTDLRISASLGIFQFTNATIRLFFFVFSLSSLWTVSLKHILRPSLAQNIVITLTFSKLRVSRSNNTKWWQLFQRFRPVSTFPKTFMSQFLRFFYLQTAPA